MKSRSDHINFQRAYFNRVVDIFKLPLPDEVDQRTREIVALTGVSKTDRLLDVGTGTGVLVQYFLEFGVPASSIVGCDLSSQMLGEAQSRYPEVTFVQADIDELPLEYGPFTVAFFNGCFGNLYNPLATLTKTVQLLSKDGRIVISHPLGNAFVAELKAKEPELVLRLLPAQADLLDWCAELNCNLEAFSTAEDFYLAILDKGTLNKD